MTYTVLIEKGPTSYGAYIPDLPGCVAVDETREEVESLIQSAIAMQLRGMREDGEPIPEPTVTAAVKTVRSAPGHLAGKRAALTFGGSSGSRQIFSAEG
jgi:predicted RNase H-like HicB family nuclease